MTDEKEVSLKMLSTALEMEKKGISFYEQALSKCRNEVGREIYTMLRDDERVHIDRIMKIYSSLEAGSDWIEEWKGQKLSHGDLGGLFVDLTKRHGKDFTADADDIQALDVGVDFELTAVDFYLKHLERAEDPKEREFLELMVKEERSHFKILDDMRFYLTDPEAWFMEMEKSGLDGA
ncbi:MAG: ferritin family protein [Deltaproteobacteria bacterium]|uniref:Ferritin family protein n=1 Tax=Candidatus Zymogenus saltonus TaxID=2844893 RepID=A0A9D8PPS4_9DELT|nr:ferritin family protein [Candidatus Zymogenus saltonus]